ncbi:MAG: DUF4912 domain-containing protein [Synechococcales cyanobacterium]
MTQDRTPLEELTLRELRRKAMELDISRYSRMTKEQLISAIQEARMQTSGSAARDPGSKDKVEATKFDSGVETAASGKLADVDAGLGDLPAGYGQSRIVLLPRDPQWAYAYWDVPNEHKEQLRYQGGMQLALRLYDVTDVNLDTQGYHSMQEFPCDELAREWYLPISMSDRSYVAEIGYRCGDGRWLVLARSAAVMIPPTYPSDWFDEHFATVTSDMDLRGKTIYQLVEPHKRRAAGVMGMAGGIAAPTVPTITDEIFKLAGALQANHVAGSLFGSQHMVPEIGLGGWTESGAGLAAESISSFALVPGAPWMASGSGLGLFSGASEVMPQRSRQFWLVADAELIVYGATEPDATVTIAGRPIKLNPDGTFRFHMAFPDGNIDFPIFAVAVDGEQNREIHMTFDRQTLRRRTNTKEEAVEELF